MKLLLFAQLAELAGEKEIAVPKMHDTDALVAYMNAHYEKFSTSSYVIAVEKEIIQKNTLLQEHSVIAFLPPFSGG